VVGIRPARPEPIEKFNLLHPFPNPLNPTTAINYQLPAVSFVSLEVYDTAGRLVSALFNGRQEAGLHQIIFDGSNLAAGIYFAKLKAGDYMEVEKVVLLK